MWNKISGYDSENLKLLFKSRRFLVWLIRAIFKSDDFLKLLCVAYDIPFLFLQQRRRLRNSQFDTKRRYLLIHRGNWSQRDGEIYLENKRKEFNLYTGVKVEISFESSMQIPLLGQVKMNKRSTSIRFVIYTDDSVNQTLKTGLKKHFRSSMTFLS